MKKYAVPPAHTGGIALRQVGPWDAMRTKPSLKGKCLDTEKALITLVG
jgi:hypothetical protein